jgi:hypothetical protein
MDWSVELMAAAMTFASPANAWMLSTFSAADFSGPAMLIVAIAFLAPIETQDYRATALQTQGAWASRINVIFAGLASGFAVGTKIPFVLAALVIGLWILLEAIYRTRRKTPACCVVCSKRSDNRQLLVHSQLDYYW